METGSVTCLHCKAKSRDSIMLNEVVVYLDIW